MIGNRILDSYRKFKRRNPDALYAFGGAQFVLFVMADAHRIHDALPDVQMERGRCDFVRVHRRGLPVLEARLSSASMRVIHC